MDFKVSGEGYVTRGVLESEFELESETPVIPAAQLTRLSYIFREEHIKKITKAHAPGFSYIFEFDFDALYSKYMEDVRK